MDLELRHLRIVCAIADAGSVTKAAAALGLAQPAMTTQLKRIERALGGPLFVRDRRGTSPTPLGDMVLARARVLLPALDGLQTEATDMIRSGQPRSFRIGATNGPVSGGLVQRLAEAHPGAHVAMTSSWEAEELAQLVVDDRLDFALVGMCDNTLPAGGRSLTWREVCVDPVWVLVGDEHPLLGQPEVTLAELAAEKWVTVPGGGCFNDCFAAACATAGFTPRPYLEMDVASVFDVVSAGSAVALCQGTVRDVPGVGAIPLAGTPLRWRHVLGWNASGNAAEVAEKVRELAVETYLSVVAQRPAYTAWLRDHPGFGARSHA
ncbi:MAG: LysR family transcriptional regulator [Actinoplanes sp.]